MDVKTVYELVGGDYEDVVKRLRKEERVGKFLGLFLKDTAFGDLKAAMEADDMEKAFVAAHTAKGVCGNLSLERLRRMVSDLTEDLRGGKDIAHAKEVYPEVAACYEKTVEIIKSHLEE